MNIFYNKFNAFFFTFHFFLIKGSFDHFWSVLFQRVHMCVFHRYTVFVLVAWWLISSCRKWRKWCRVIRSHIVFLSLNTSFLCSFCSSALQYLYSLYKLFLSITRKLFLQLKPDCQLLNWTGFLLHLKQGRPLLYWQTLIGFEAIPKAAAEVYVSVYDGQ